MKKSLLFFAVSALVLCGCDSQQKEFCHYYGNSRKQVTVYLYGPSVGMFDPYAAYYLVFTEQ